MKFRLCTLALVPLLLLLSGCGSDVGPTYPVEGVVTLDGKPLSHGTVVFWPDQKKGNTCPYPASAEIGEDGKYSLSIRGQEGAPEGVYEVTVVCESEADSTKPEKVKSLIPEKYTLRAESLHDLKAVDPGEKRPSTPLSVRVVEDPAQGAYDLQLKTK